MIGDADGDGELSYDEVKGLYYLCVAVDGEAANGATADTEYTAEEI